MKSKENESNPKRSKRIHKTSDIRELEKMQRLERSWSERCSLYGDPGR